ncbi:hypothetical protein WICMUC_002559 [Wickerhamomyces mucosus]|uniref:RING-type E3 ubiquitin transferase n=1 Tax=Wickerhamomyces mucosus TaxID=1378264 RepID=A0A9P8PQ87_9ASCO|nr:hypothetical protein WICMUC_002559 [Wickerhamomyces mucosus]
MDLFPRLSHSSQFLLYLVSSSTFYSAGVQLAEGFSTIILANWLIAISLALGKLFQTIFFGQLRLIEMEHIMDRSGFTVINSLFALSMFSSDFILIPGILTLFLLFMKVFHGILKDRFEFIFQNATTFKEVLLTRNSITLLLFIYLDFHLVYSCIEYSFSTNPDVYFAFGFEFAILLLDLLLQSFKIILNVWELYYLTVYPEEETMENKGWYLKIIYLVHTGLTLGINLFLLFTFIGPYRFPVYLFKDIFTNSLNLFKQITEFQRYRKASKELETKLQDAAEEQLVDNNLCIICRDDMTTQGIRKGDRLYPKVLTCGHIIHLGCLKGWFERSQVCPMCRAPVFEAVTQNRQNQEQQQLQPDFQDQENDQALEADQQANIENIEIPDLHNLGIPPFIRDLNNYTSSPTATSISPVAAPPINGNNPRTVISALSSSTTDDHTLKLTPNSLVPPDWTLLRLAKKTDDSFQIELNQTTLGDLIQKGQNPNVTINEEASASGKLPERF